MRGVFLFLFFLVNSFLSAQSPQGKLYVFTGAGGVPPPSLAYFDYPSETYHTIESVQLSDIAIMGDKLLAAAYLDLLIYDTSTNLVIDTIRNIYPRQVTSWGDKIVIASIRNPYFRVYDAQTLGLVFSLDTFKLSQTPVDINVSGDRAFLLLDDTVVVVDLLMQDTIANIFTPHPFPFAGYNMYFADAGPNLYIDVEYVTGAIRFSLMRMNKTSLVVDTVFHKEGYGNFTKPVVAANDIYLGGFDTHYSITDDSLYISTNHWSPVAVEYDAVSGAVFLFHSSGNGINYFRTGNYSDTLNSNGYVAGALFVSSSNDTLTSIKNLSHPLSSLLIQPNPVSTDFEVQFNIEATSEGELTLFDITGRQSEVLFHGAIKSGEKKQFSLLNYPDGIYILRLKTQSEIMSSRIFIYK